MLKSLIRFGTLLLLTTVVLTACRKKAWDEYYGRPENLEPPIYMLLEERGNFTHLLKAIDKAGYKTTLGTAGYWTFFAPHDSAFEAYFRRTGVSGIEQLDSVTCQKLVTYNLTYNAFNKTRIDDFQANSGWFPNNAFKRRTAYYSGIYTDVNQSGQSVKTIASNRNNNGLNYFVDADNNNKHMPIFTDTFFNAKALSAADYNYFYPNTSFTGFNIMDAVVIEKDIAAENGVIHIVNKVLEPLPSIDEYLRSKPEYSEFKKIFDRFLVEFVLNPMVTQRNQVLTGVREDVFTKVYNANLAFSLNNENFLKIQDNDAQSNSFSLFAPTNAPLLAYINSVLLQHYSSIEQLPINILYDFVNAHLWQTAVWPSTFNNSFNFLGEPARFNAQADITDRQLLSNGFFYGTNKVQQSNLFSSVYGKVYLNPAYSYMNRLLDQEMKFIISNPQQRFLLFMVSNQAWNEAGYFADASVDNNPAFQWRYVPPGGGATVIGSSALVRMLRLINQLVVPDPKSDLENLNGSGIARTFGGEYVRWNSSEILTSGNLDSNYHANSLELDRAVNGTVLYIDKLLTYTEVNPGIHVRRLGELPTSKYNLFFQYLNGSPLYNAGSGEILGLSAGVFYTVLAPDNAAILKAVEDGLLPGTQTGGVWVPNFRPTNPIQIENVTRFLQYHILNRAAIATDGEGSGAYETLLRNGAGEATTIFVNNTVPNTMRVTDMEGEIGNVDVPISNYLSNRVVIHSIDNYLRYIY